VRPWTAVGCSLQTPQEGEQRKQALIAAMVFQWPCDWSALDRRTGPVPGPAAFVLHAPRTWPPVCVYKFESFATTVHKRHLNVSVHNPAAWAAGTRHGCPAYPLNTTVTTRFGTFINVQTISVFPSLSISLDHGPYGIFGPLLPSTFLSLPWIARLDPPRRSPESGAPSSAQAPR